MIVKEDFIWSLDLKGQYPTSELTDSVFKLMAKDIFYITDLNNKTQEKISDTISSEMNETYPHSTYRLKITFSIKNMSLKNVCKEDLLDFLGSGELHWVHINANPHHSLLTKREFNNV